MESHPRIILDEDDFAEHRRSRDERLQPSSTAATEQRAGSTAPTRPSALPAVNRGVPFRVGADPAMPTSPLSDASRWLVSPSTAPLIAAAIGVVLAWAITEALGIAEIQPTSKLGSDAQAALWTGTIGTVFSGVLLVFDSAVGGVWNVVGKRFAAASLPMFGAAFLAGFAANALYLQILQGPFEDAARGGRIISGNDATFYLARGIGWALFGAGIGVTVGLLARSRQRAINGGLGGALGGAAGGLLFQFIVVNVDAATSTSRLIGLIGIGALIAMATRLVETSRREAWLQVLTGGMAGKEFILYHPTTRLGSSPDCEIFLLKDPSVAKLHAQIQDNGGQRVLTAPPGSVVQVNGARIDTRVLHQGDRIQIGNTIIGYSERALARTVVT